eukprot:871313-Pelagomonas_calceolata.AAC.4
MPKREWETSSMMKNSVECITSRNRKKCRVRYKQEWLKGIGRAYSMMKNIMWSVLQAGMEQDCGVHDRSRRGFKGLRHGLERDVQIGVQTIYTCNTDCSFMFAKM